MSVDFDVIIVGSGPAGVSAAFPLLEAGQEVLLVDGGRTPSVEPPAGSYLARRAADAAQWKWMVGEDFHALARADAVSPKLRAPTLDYVFEGFASTNRVEAADFVAIGSLAVGGLSNAWGCGVAALSAQELRAFPVPPEEMQASFAYVAKRMGVSGAVNDDLSDYFGLDAWAQPPLPMDALQSRLYARYATGVKRDDFRLGRSRVAALSQNLGRRPACDLSGTCLWGCAQGSLYSATHDLAQLVPFRNLTYKPGFVVESVASTLGGAEIVGRTPKGVAKFSARHVLLAAGTLASTRLALQALGHTEPLKMKACPTSAFLLWAPQRLGAAREAAFGLGQLSFTLDLEGGARGFGSLFNATGIPLAEFSRFMPLRKRGGIDVLSWIMSSCAVGNIFLSGEYTRASLQLTPQGSLRVEGRYDEAAHRLMSEAQRKLRTAFLRLGAILLPGSFRLGQPGGDIHYAASLPMRQTPGPGESDAQGQVFGLPGVHVVDGAALSSLSEKSHTLTLMANADRIGRRLARRLQV